MKEKQRDRYNIDSAILTGDEVLKASTLANPYYAAALVRAYIDWMVDYWLPKDSRCKGSLMSARIAALCEGSQCGTRQETPH
jgi:hypothetical protein